MCMRPGTNADDRVDASAQPIELRDDFVEPRLERIVLLQAFGLVVLDVACDLHGSQLWNAPR